MTGRKLSELRARREALGLTLERVGADTRIPIHHLEAIESDALGELPGTAYADGYVRAYRRYLGLPDAAFDTADGDHPPTASAGSVRWVQSVAAGSIMGLCGVVVWQMFGASSPAVKAPGLAGIEPSQTIEMQAKVTTPLQIWVDGEVFFDQVLQGGASITASGKESIEIEVPAVRNLRITYNEESVRPQGVQDTPRRLVFINDLSGGG